MLTAKAATLGLVHEAGKTQLAPTAGSPFRYFKVSLHLEHLVASIIRIQVSQSKWQALKILSAVSLAIFFFEN